MLNLTACGRPDGSRSYLGFNGHNDSMKERMLYHRRIGMLRFNATLSLVILGLAIVWVATAEGGPPKPESVGRVASNNDASSHMSDELEKEPFI